MYLCIGNHVQFVIAFDTDHLHHALCHQGLMVVTVFLSNLFTTTRIKVEKVEEKSHSNEILH